MHSSAWDDSVALDGRRVGVVGTGASAAQLIPHLAQTAASVVVFQRSAPYVVPRPDRRTRPTSRPASRPIRARSGDARRPLLGRRDGIRRADARARLHRSAARPRARAPRGAGRRSGLRAAATPDYEIGCKRVIISNDYYPALASPTVTLEPSALRSVSGSVATSADGRSVELDVLVFATGFESTRPPFAARSSGPTASGSPTLDTGMRAHASTTVHGFPNMFVSRPEREPRPQLRRGHDRGTARLRARRSRASSDEASSARRVARGRRRLTREIDAKASSSVWSTGDATAGTSTSAAAAHAAVARLRLRLPATVSRFDPEN